MARRGSKKSQKLEEKTTEAEVVGICWDTTCSHANQIGQVGLHVLEAAGVYIALQL
jgi:hypothetical protein